MCEVALMYELNPPLGVRTTSNLVLLLRRLLLLLHAGLRQGTLFLCCRGEIIAGTIWSLPSLNLRVAGKISCCVVSGPAVRNIWSSWLIRSNKSGVLLYSPQCHDGGRAFLDEPQKRQKERRRKKNNKNNNNYYYYYGVSELISGIELRAERAKRKEDGKLTSSLPSQPGWEEPTRTWTLQYNTHQPTKHPKIRY